MKALIIDCDYLISRNGIPTIRLYCKKVNCSDEGKDIVVHIRDFEPYCYVEGLELAQVEEITKDYIKHIEVVQKYRPIGYQEHPTEMLKLTLFNPKNTPAVRKLVENAGGLSYEADIQFKNRYLIDSGICGMSIISFNEEGRKLNNYGISIDELYIVDKEEISTSNEVVKFEY